jgi:hypothetical protein
MPSHGDLGSISLAGGYSLEDAMMLFMHHAELEKAFQVIFVKPVHDAI